MSETVLNETCPMGRWFEKWRLLILLIISAAVTLVSLHYLTTYYRLLIFPGYDDITYFYNAGQWVEAFYTKGIPGVFHEYLKHGAHAPISVLQAFFSYMIFGYQTWAPYVSNILIVFTMLLFSDRMIKSLPGLFRIILYLFVCAIPLLSLSVCEFRPDFFWGIVTAFGTLIPLKEQWLLKSRKYQIAWGVVAGLSLISKTSTCMATSFFYVSSAVIAFALVYLTQKENFNWKSLFQSLGWVVLTALIVAVPHYIVDLHNIINYIYQALVTNKAVWDYKDTPINIALYYFWGPGGHVTLHKTSLLLLGMVIVSHILLVLKRPFNNYLPFCAMTLMVIILYTIPTIASLKNPFLGSGFAAGLAFLALAGLDFIYQSWIFPVEANKSICRTRWSVYGAVVLTVTLVAVFLYHFPPAYGTSQTARIQNQNEIFDTVYNGLVTHLTDAPSSLELGVEGPVIEGSLELNAWFHHVDHLTFDSMSFVDNLPAAEKRVSTYNFVVAQEQGTDSASLNLPSSKIQGGLLKWLQQNPKFVAVTQTRAFNGKRVVLFQRIDPYFMLHSRYGTVGGGDSHVIGTDGESAFTILDDKATSGHINLAFNTLKKVQSVDVYLDDQPIQTIHTEPAHTTTQASFPITLKPLAGPHILRLKYSPDFTTEPPQPKIEDVEFLVLQFIPNHQKTEE